jgi:hypothetical protein
MIVFIGVRPLKIGSQGVPKRREPINLWRESVSQKNGSVNCTAVNVRKKFESALSTDGRNDP